VRIKWKHILGERVYDTLARALISPAILRNIRHVRNPDFKTSAKHVVDYLLSDSARHIRPWQHRSELVELARIIEERQPKILVEIGTASGGTLFMASALAPEDALIISIDLPHGKFGGGYPEWRMTLYQQFARDQQTIVLMRGDSHSTEMRDRLTRTLQGKRIDYLFIDGDHTYEGVKKDFYTYREFMNSNSVIAFHDIVCDKDPAPDHFVSHFWDEIKEDYRYKEFIESPDQSKYGIGVIYLDS
jgi:cephalosporin hydroxylase